MLWPRKALYCTATLVGGCYSFALLKNTVTGNSETSDVKKNTFDEISSYIYIPELSGHFFTDNNEYSDWVPLLHINSPLYWQLFMLTKSRKRSVRHKAIKLLTESSNLEKWEYMMVAQACEPTTAVGLARSSKLHKYFFLPPPFRNCKKENLNEELLNLISSLSSESVEPKILTEKAKLISKRISRKKDLNAEPENSLEIYHSEQKKRDVFEFNKLCLQILLYYSTIKSHRFLMIKNGILKIFWEFINYFENETELQCIIAQILANLSLEEELIGTLSATGWVGILASWSSSQYINVSLPSIKALANLDTDDYHHSLYDNDIYLLHPVMRTSEKESSADIIFLHGLFGSTFWTWRQSDAMKTITHSQKDLNNLNIIDRSSFSSQSYTFCWPKDWLAVDFPNLRFLSIDYNTDIRNWKSLFLQHYENENLSTKAKLLIDKLIKANVGSKPIIWVTHSMGGILVKHLLKEAEESQDLNAQSIVKNTCGVIFFSVPHKGSEFVQLLQSFPYIFHTPAEISQFCTGSLMLLSLHEKFTDLVQKYKIAVLSFGETKKSKWGLNLVSEDSSNPEIGEFHALQVDHLSTCKPDTRDSKVYIELKKFLQTHIPDESALKSANIKSEICNLMCLVP